MSKSKLGEFDYAHYGERIESVLAVHRGFGLKPDTFLLAQAIMTGLCSIAESIDNTNDSDDMNTIAGSLQGIRDAIEDVAEALREHTHREEMGE